MDLTQIFNFATENSSSDSGVIAAIISGVLALVGIIFKSTHESKLKYITNERKAWRDKLRDIMYQIYKTKDINKTKFLLTELYTRLNSYGYYNEDDILNDGHIWSLIKTMEKTNNEAIMNNCKKKLRMYISLLLKFDWERAKREVGIKSFSLLSVGFYIIACSFTIYSFYIEFGNSELLSIIFIGLLLCIIYIVPSILVNVIGGTIGKIDSKHFWYPLFLIISIAMFIDFKVRFNDNRIIISLVLFSVALVLDYISCISNTSLDKKYKNTVREFQKKSITKKVKIKKK